MRAGGELRGSASDRRARKMKLLLKFGTGITCPCLLRIHPCCERQLSFGTLTVDRLIPGSAGGRYVWGNILPACIRCNERRRDKPLRHVMSSRRVKTLMARMEKAGAL